MDKAAWLKWRKTGDRKTFADMVRDNEPLVASIVAKMRARSNFHLESFEDDMMQAGRIGLMRAIQAWQPKRGAFSTCAWFWVRREIQGVMRSVLPIRRNRLGDLPPAIQRAQEAYEARHGESPGPEEIGTTQEVLDQADRERFTYVFPDDGEASGWEKILGSTPDPEGAIDRARDEARLRDFLALLSPKQRRQALNGKYLEAAREYIEWRRDADRQGV